MYLFYFNQKMAGIILFSKYLDSYKNIEVGTSFLEILIVSSKIEIVYMYVAVEKFKALKF